MKPTPLFLLLVLVLLTGENALSQQTPPAGPFTDEKSGKVIVPRRQAGPPGPPTPPEEAAKKMTVPEGFTVEVVAAEPDLVNPVAMAIDDQGRFWVTESFEYPRKEPGLGRDRIKLLEDTNGDGKIDRFTIFADGLNIPSGIAVGHGGVWVANAPDLLFLQDTDGDGVADTRKVVLTGFGRTDTHELPNSLCWGPDGYLYGLNGVFNHCVIKHRGREIPMTCAMWRLNPVADTEGEWKGTHDFELFAEGTSNPWGIAWNENGDAFLSACVIDHLWHLNETGYYHRQGGPYPPHTWKLESIVEHQHQMAAYCGITWFDSDAYPEEYREKLYMGNIHGGCINVDALERRGSSYFATPRADFVTANDVWHMPVAQQTGPDGCLYILDWYDRYHCYQDANADPAGVDRTHGRLYRVRYRDTPRAPAFDLAKEEDEKLVGRLGSPNVFYRERAQRLISERLISRSVAEAKKLRDEVEKVVLDETQPRKARMHALWGLIGSQRLGEDFHLILLSHAEPQFRAWGVRAAGNADAVAEPVRKRIAALAGDESPDVLLQVAVAAGKVEGLDAPALLAEVLAQCGDDAVIPHIVWQNLVPRLGDPKAVEALLSRFEKEMLPGFLAMAPVLGEYFLTGGQPNLTAFVRAFDRLRQSGSPTAGELLANLGRRVRNREIRLEALAPIRPQLEAAILPLLSGEGGNDLRFDAAVLAASWKRPEALAVAAAALADSKVAEDRRIAAAEAVANGGSVGAVGLLQLVLADPAAPTPLRRAALSALGRVEAPAIAEATLAAYGELPAALQRDAVELLTRRPEWSRGLLAAIEAGRIPAAAINPMQVRTMAAADASLKPAIEALWGRVRTDRNPQREQVIARILKLTGEKTGDWKNGKAVFARACSACHKLHGEGNLIGPDITVSGRGTLEQLLSNVFDPNLVIGESYQARIVNTMDGRAVMGLPVEDNDQRVVVRPPTGKDEVIARADVKSVDVLPISLMPEGLEAAMTEQELIDLINYLAWDLHPEDPKATALSGVKLK